MKSLRHPELDDDHVIVVADDAVAMYAASGWTEFPLRK